MEELNVSAYIFPSDMATLISTFACTQPTSAKCELVAYNSYSVSYSYHSGTVVKIVMQLQIHNTDTVI